MVRIWSVSGPCLFVSFRVFSCLFVSFVRAINYCGLSVAACLFVSFCLNGLILRVFACLCVSFSSDVLRLVALGSVCSQFVCALFELSPPLPLAPSLPPPSLPLPPSSCSFLPGPLSLSISLAMSRYQGSRGSFSTLTSATARHGACTHNWMQYWQVGKKHSFAICPTRGWLLVESFEQPGCSSPLLKQDNVLGS